MRSYRSLQIVLYTLWGAWLVATPVCAAQETERTTLLGEHSSHSPRYGRTLENDDKCPPCFNCALPIFECKQFSQCNTNTGRCECLEGFAGDDCSIPVCGGLSDDNDKRPRRPKDTNECDCKPGWGGINCNICEEDFVCDAFMPEKDLKGTCYRNGMIVNRLYQGCDVTNEKILEILKGKKPQVTFSCDKKKQSCNFQFWIDRVESFYCELDTCTFEHDLKTNSSHYNCQNVQCKCVPDAMLCGANGSIDISDFLTETIRGPGDFNCDLDAKDCQFKEPAMNDLIETIFGDPYITLHCESGECLHYSEIPGYNPPSKDIAMSWRAKVILSLTSVSLLALITFVSFYISKSPLFKNGTVHLVEDVDTLDESFLKSDNVAALSFDDIRYKVSGSNIEEYILKGISGAVKPGEIMAFLGGSGAGKTTLLDILAMKRKTGQVTGSIKVNGSDIPRKYFTKLIGFVDQDDYLLPTLTVYETVLNSALLRLPRSLSFAAKQARVYQVLEELRILEIKDRVIGNDFERGISGGEKRRVSIACELVTSPLILFLDEPTSGLDANNANNVVECLVRLAKTHNRTLVLSIHQPRSNIFQLFDKLVLLSNGEMVYSGDAIRVGEFLRNNGYRCPSDYNIADYLIDITFEAKKKSTVEPARRDLEASAALFNPNSQKDSIHPALEERTDSVGSFNQREWEHFAGHRDEIRNLLSESNDPQAETVGSMNTKLLTHKFKEGPYYAELKLDIDTMVANHEQSPVQLPSSLKSASFLQQLSILCSRTFKNIYRNPKLLLGNYLLTLILALFLGTLYYDVSNDISGFQNRMGLFFFVLTYFGFVTFTGLSSFAMERIIFIKERSNNYYSPLAYFISKILSDVLPLRVIPPVLLALVVYPLVGLNMKNQAFFIFIGVLVLFNLGISLEILAIGIIFEDLNNSIIFSVLVLLGSLLFSGLFINTKDISSMAFKYLKNFSLFYYAYESLLINEVKRLTLRETKYGLKIEVPGATILSTFGFVVQNMVFDIKILALFNVLFLLIGYLSLKLIVVEQK